MKEDDSKAGWSRVFVDHQGRKFVVVDGKWVYVDAEG